MSRYSLAQQRQSVEHVLAQTGRDEPDDSIADAVRQACLTLAWLERRAELIRALDRLERERPELVDLFQAFPDTTIADVRNRYDDAAE